MGHYQLETEIGRNGDSAWPLWGLAMRLCQAVRPPSDGPANGQMGLHRDGAKWNLPAETVEERRCLRTVGLKRHESP
jgi:hypothetical protein